MALSHEDSEGYPLQGRAVDSFRRARQMQAVNRIKAREGTEKLWTPSETAAQYFNDGLKYLRQSGDPYIELVENEAVAALLADEKVAVFDVGGAEPAVIQKQNPDDKPFLFFPPKGQAEYDYTEQGGFFIFPSLIIEAQISPTFVLADLAGNLSLVRDYIHGRMFTDGAKRMAIRRAEATKAHVLHGIMREDPSTHEEILLGHSKLLVRYPRGIKSLPGGEYRAIGRDPQNN